MERGAKYIVVLCVAAATAVLSGCNGKEGPKPAIRNNNYTVIEYMPAPGQYINNPRFGFDGNETTPEKAAGYADKALKSGVLINGKGDPVRVPVSLGGFGGYIVVKFDSSIKSYGKGSGKHEFSIVGNQFEGSSEPGVVWVSRDSNGNGLADDIWYELAGSEHVAGRDRKEYLVTYFRSAAAKQDIVWKDVDGVEGTIERVGITISPQDSYYPLWLDGLESYTLKGTLLPENLSVDVDSGNYVAAGFEWGYADNYSKADIAFGKGQYRNFFSISNAVDVEGNYADLEWIDFVKVHTGVLGKGDNIGELSTEVCGFRDETLQD